MTTESASLEAEFVRSWPPAEWQDLHVLLAVSAGTDSVALLRAALAVKDRVGGGGRLLVAHLNHGLRGAEAAADEAWLAKLCRRLAVPLEVGRADVAALASQQRDGIEAAARTARYDFLRCTAERLGARFVATAQTADDQVETVVHRLIRGTGLDGLAGMRPVRPLSPSVSLVRPLLGVWRADVSHYLDALGQDYRVDSTNADLRFTRNRLRREVLPLLRSQFNTDFDRAVIRLAQQAAEAQRVIAAIAGRLVHECAVFSRPTRPSAGDQPTVGSNVVASADTVRIDREPLADQPELIVREVCKAAWEDAGWPLQDMGFDQWQQVAVLVTGDQSAAPFHLPGGILAQREGRAVVLRRAVES